MREINCRIGSDKYLTSKQITKLTKTTSWEEEISIQNCYSMLSKMSSYQQKNCGTCKETEKCDPSTYQTTDTASEGVRMVNLADKDFKAANINMLTEQKETMVK